MCKISSYIYCEQIYCVNLVSHLLLIISVRSDHLLVLLIMTVRLSFQTNHIIKTVEVVTIKSIWKEIFQCIISLIRMPSCTVRVIGSKRLYIYIKSTFNQT